MPTFNMISDIHISHQNGKNVFGCFEPEKLLPADYLLVAGDLGIADNFKSVQEELWQRTNDVFKNMYVVPGNHDYWTLTGTNISPQDEFLTVELDTHTVLLGCTMWTPIPRYEKTDPGSWRMSTEFYVSSFMRDYDYIPDFSIEKQNAIFNESNYWLRSMIKSYSSRGFKVIVMTHHGPRKKLIGSKYKGNPVNAAFFVMNGDCDDLKPAVWLSGHTHTKYDTIIDGTRFVCNPIGYHDVGRWAVVPECNVLNWYNNIITV